ncbi:hypothetical protein Htur_4633 (plasmid) [Haloterrigena turkmenica DSM 5511]|uniref:Uncharacterized protein n=1 Tax=Haloterrigena turkmenica (strain ATCC 51198 / DSM 5511 / JCM 9101 / NCIMB 13204 / VKM B-1734 / 4k) TaxID=543526 RepID=D2S222_HALTV|nr:hypothetical protein Htur_4633 [Haloterrigena turkmenica DSM 5511]
MRGDRKRLVGFLKIFDIRIREDDLERHDSLLEVLYTGCPDDRHIHDNCRLLCLKNIRQLVVCRSLHPEVVAERTTILYIEL